LGWPEETLEKVWSSYNLLTVLSLEKLLFEKAGGDGLTLEDLLARPGETPESTLIKKERQRLLAAAIQKLPPREKLLLSLYYYEDLTPERDCRLG